MGKGYKSLIYKTIISKWLSCHILMFFSDFPCYSPLMRIIKIDYSSFSYGAHGSKYTLYGSSFFLQELAHILCGSGPALISTVPSVNWQLQITVSHVRKLM